MDPRTTAPPLLYLVYIGTSLALTLLLAATLYRNGKTFLNDVFEDRPGMAEAVNHLLVVGFFMLNAGYALLIFRGEDSRAAARPADFAMERVGMLLVTLGVIHFVNMAAFMKIRHRASQPTPAATGALLRDGSTPSAPSPTPTPTPAPAPIGWAPAPPAVRWDQP